MSKFSAFFLLPTFAFLLILQLFNNSSGQQIEAVITVRAPSSQIVEIRGRFLRSGKKNFAIRREYFGVTGLAERVSGLVLEDEKGQPVAYKQFIPGEWVADREFISWRYKMDLHPLKANTAAAHTSWISGGTGLLCFYDLLPLVSTGDESRSGTIRVELPDGWRSASGRNVFESVSVEKTVSLIGKDLREISSLDPKLKISTEGEWKFSDDELKQFATEIYGQYLEIFGGPPSGPSAIFVTHFPQNVGYGTWEGDTRGSTVTIVSSDMPFQTQSKQRLHEQLRHEIFHLWLPNSVTLKGNYDWFYEGFALYQSLKTGVALNRIRFDDLLDTLGRAYTFDSALSTRPSLIEASANRNSGGDTDLYARGMVVAFLTDIELMQVSHGKRDIGTIFRSMLERFHDARSSTDGNKAVLETIALPKITKFVEGREKIDWTAELEAVGIEQTKGPTTTLSVASKLSGRQRELLDKLGYNNWRRSRVTSQ